MKTQTKKLLFILILVVSIMAILIAANQIYDIIENQKVIDNNIKGTEGDEDDLEQNYGVISQQIDIKLYEWNENATGNNINDYLIWVGNEKNDDIYEIERIIETSPSNVVSEYIKIKLKFKVNQLAAQGQIFSVNNGYWSHLLTNNGNIYIASQQENTDKYGEDENGNEYIYTGNDIIEITISKKRVADYALSNEGNFIYGGYYSSLTFYLEGKYYDKTTNNFIYGINPKISIDSNELLQVNTTINGTKLSQYIYEQITQDFGEGKETATIKCSIGEYYQYDDTKPDKKGDLAISTQNNDLPMIFDINDAVVPYIATANGQTEPLSLTIDGKPKVFKVTQIRPYFDGAFWQELQLQEKNRGQYIETVIFTSGTDGNATAGYIAQNQTVVVTKGKIVSVSLNYSTEDINTAQVSPTVSINEADNSFTIANVNLVSPNSTANIYATVIHEI